MKHRRAIEIEIGKLIKSKKDYLKRDPIKYNKYTWNLIIIIIKRGNTKKLKGIVKVDLTSISY